MWLHRAFGQLNHKMRRYDTLPILNSNFANVLQAERIYCKCPVLPGIAPMACRSAPKKLPVRGNAPGSLDRHGSGANSQFGRDASYKYGYLID